MLAAMLKLAFKFNSSRGFTLIEVLIAVAIMAILGLIALSAYNTLTKQVDLDSTSQSIISTLQLARSQTLASEGDTRYGVHFDSGQYVLFAGDTYTAGDPANKVYPLSSSEIYLVNLNGGGNEVIFDRIRGTTSQDGSISLRLTETPSRTITIAVDTQGGVSVQNTLSPTGTVRITDNRHLHFSLGWSLQGRTTLTLTFTDSPNPTVTQNIAMSSYFNAGQTVFDWSGTIDVNGTNQVLRIHTHSLDAFNTTLSIHRDERYNNKALTVSIDSLQVVSYTASGDATVGPSGGVMTAQ